MLLLVLVVMSTGCTDKDDTIEIEKGKTYSVAIPAEKGDVLYIKWESDGKIQWQLSDDNDTRLPSQPKFISGSEREKPLELHQNATYILTFENQDTKTITLQLEWEIR